MYVFVYGTLKRGCPNHYVIENKENGAAEYVSDGKTTDLFPLIVTTKYEVPFLLDKRGHGKNVSGEIYKIDDKMLQFLDKFENNPEVYIREEAEIEITPPTNGHPKTVTAWIFVFHSFRNDLLDEQYFENYICNNYDVLRSISGKVSPEERKQLLDTLRIEIGS